MPRGADWDGFREMMRDSADLFDLEDVVVHNYTGGYDEASGETNWTRDSGTTVQAQMTIGSGGISGDQTGIRPEGAEGDMYIRDDAESYYSIDLVPVGVEGQRPTEIVYDGAVYVLRDIDRQHNGLFSLSLTEDTD